MATAPLPLPLLWFEPDQSMAAAGARIDYTWTLNAASLKIFGSEP
jgi:hypothetical protein